MSVPARRLRDYTAAELVPVALFFIAGSILSLAFAVIYIGVSAFTLAGADLDWFWQHWN